MYEKETYEVIMERCLARVPNSIDKREGSILFDALAPACAELAILYTELDNILDRAFPDTATGDDLDRKCAERSIVRKPATAAVRKATFTNASGGAMAVPLGTRFSGGAMNYKVAEAIGQGEFKLTAELPGSSGNTYFGTLLPIDFVEGLAGAELSDVLIPGEDEEGDESLRKRYFASYDLQAFGGNAADYKERIGAMDGVGGVKIARAPSGGGTVGVTIVSSQWTVPTSELISAVQTAVDPVVNRGAGVGIAPIGHTVTVSGVIGKTIKVSFTLTFEANVTWSNVQTDVTTAIRTYFETLTKSWADSASLTVRISQIETRVLAVPGVLDITETKLNGFAANLQLTATEIPLLGSVTNGAT